MVLDCGLGHRGKLHVVCEPNTCRTNGEKLAHFDLRQMMSRAPILGGEFTSRTLSRQGANARRAEKCMRTFGGNACDPERFHQFFEK
jgi:hypothetical protein